MREFVPDIIHRLSATLPQTLAGLLVGVMAALLIRAGQVWRYRQYYGHSVYDADRIQRWLYRWAIRAVLLVVLGGIAYGWLGSNSVSAPDTLAQSLPPTPALTTPARLVIPRIGVSALLVEVPITGWEWDITRMAAEVGHLEGTPEPGAPGNAVVAGHVTDLAGVPGPFWELASLQHGDNVYLEQDNIIFKYEIVEIKRVDPQDVDALYQSSYPTQLTLLTCDAFDPATETYQKRLIVIARQVHS